MAVQTIQTTLQCLHSAGLAVTLTPEKGIKVSPASGITDAMRAMIMAQKVEIVAYLVDAANDPAPPSSTDRLRAASLALDAVIAASGMVADPDRWSYPHGDAKNGEEIDAFLIRQSLFVQQGLAMKQAECLADRLVIRAREYDDRTVCLECVHLQRTGRCGNWQRAGLATRSSDAQLGGDFVILLQRCDGFAGVLPMDGRGNHG
jgi:hypothetical protein